MLHEIAVLLSFCGFAARGAAAIAGAAWVRGRLARTVPHVVDTVLLASALALVVIARLNPLTTSWLLAKILGLLAYIVLGMVALQAPRRGVRIAAWIAALLVFAWIVSVAFSKSPAGFLSSI